MARSRPLTTDDPPGTPVFLVEDDGTVTLTKTRSSAWQLGHDEWVVLVEGKTGGYALRRLSVAEAGQ